MHHLLIYDARVVRLSMSDAEHTSQKPCICYTFRFTRHSWSHKYIYMPMHLCALQDKPTSHCWHVMTAGDPNLISTVSKALPSCSVLRCFFCFAPQNHMVVSAQKHRFITPQSLSCTLCCAVARVTLSVHAPSGEPMSVLCLCAVSRLNAAEMFVDVSQEGDSTSTNWVAESGVLDLFLLLGPTPRQVSGVVVLWHALHL